MGKWPLGCPHVDNFFVQADWVDHNFSMEKYFDDWNPRKKSIHYDKVRPHFHEREIWFCSLGVNIGFEQDGVGDRFLRPILILRKFNNDIFWGLPLTRTTKKSPYYYLLEGSTSVAPSSIILSQIRLIDAKRLQYKIGDVSPVQLSEIKEALKALLK